MPIYKVTGLYPTYPGLHPLDDAPREQSESVEARTESQAAIEAVTRGLLPVAYSVRRSGESVALYWRPGLYGTQQPPRVVDSAPSEVVLGFGDNLDAHRLTLAVWPDDFPALP